MQKRRAIIKLSFVLFAVVVGLILAFVPIKIGMTTFKGFASDIKLGIDLKGGVYAVYQVSDKELDRDNLDERLDSTSARLLTMLQDKGYMEAQVTREGDERIRVEVPDVDNPDEFFQLMGEPADMQFKLYSDAETFVKDTGITGKMVKKAYAVNYEGGYGVQLELNPEGSTLFAEVTTNNVGKFINIFVNDASVSIAEIKEGIAGGKPVISGGFSSEEATALAQKILAGALDVRLDKVESDVISATLGVDALKFSLLAGIIGLVFIMGYLGFIYRGMGLIADLALLIYTALFIFLLWSFPWVQLSLPGIAGIILSLGMAVDANVIIYERIREEYRMGKTLSSSVAAGFKKSLWTVLDANITTIIAAVVLIILGRGTVQGFGITLLMGILMSLFTALLVSRGLFKIFLQITKNNPAFYGLKRAEGVEVSTDGEGGGGGGVKDVSQTAEPTPQIAPTESQTESDVPLGRPLNEGGTI